MRFRIIRVREGVTSNFPRITPNGAVFCGIIRMFISCFARVPVRVMMFKNT